MTSIKQTTIVLEQAITEFQNGKITACEFESIIQDSEHALGIDHQFLDSVL